MKTESDYPLSLKHHNHMRKYCGLPPASTLGEGMADILEMEEKILHAAHIRTRERLALLESGEELIDVHTGKPMTLYQREIESRIARRNIEDYLTRTA